MTPFKSVHIILNIVLLLELTTAVFFVLCFERQSLKSKDGQRLSNLWKSA